MYKKSAEAHEKLLICQFKLTAFLPFSLPSPSSLLRLPFLVGAVPQSMRAYMRPQIQNEALRIQLLSLPARSFSPLSGHWELRIIRGVKQTHLQSEENSLELSHSVQILSTAVYQITGTIHRKDIPVAPHKSVQWPSTQKSAPWK